MGAIWLGQLFGHAHGEVSRDVPALDQFGLGQRIPGPCQTGGQLDADHGAEDAAEDAALASHRSAIHRLAEPVG